VRYVEYIQCRGYRGKVDIYYKEGSVKVRKQKMIKQLKNMVKSYKDD